MACGRCKREKPFLPLFPPGPLCYSGTMLRVLALLLIPLPAVLMVPDRVPAAAAPSPVLHFSAPTGTTPGGTGTAPAFPARRGPRIGLALAGGGARAAASLGVLKVLQQEGIAVTAIAGTSGGALVGGLHAAGYAPEDIERIFLATNWNDIFTDTPRRAFLTQEQKKAGSGHLLEFTFVGGSLVPPAGLTAGQKLTNLLAARTLAASFEADMDFDRLPIPFRAVATDIETGDTVVIGRGLLHDALLASSAVPLVFRPVEIDGHLLVDGGMSNNLPVEAVRALGADIVIAVDPSSKLEGKERLSTLFSIVNQAVSLHVRRETERQARLADLLIVPQVDAYSFTDFPAVTEIIRKGEEAAREALPRIRELLQAARTAQAAPLYRIRSLTVRGMPDEAPVRAALASLLGPAAVTGADIEDALAAVLAGGPFTDAVLDLEPRGDAFDAAASVTLSSVVTAVTVTGNTLVSTAEVRDLLRWQLGSPFHPTRLAADLDTLVARLRGQGYLLARVQHAGQREDGTLEIVLFEGRIDTITYHGRTRTRRSLIQRETRTRAGMPLNFLTAEDDIQRLYALDYFESIDVDMERSPRGGVDIRLKVREKPTNRIRLGLRYDLEDAFTGLTDIVVDNITGRGIKAFLLTRYGNYTDVTLGYTSPVLLRTNFLHTVQAFYRKRDYLLYENGQQVSDREVTRSGIEMAFGYQWFRFGDTYLRYRYESDTSREGPRGAFPMETDRIGSWAFLTSMDTRDSSTFPHAGILFRGSYEVASPSYGGDTEFRKTALAAQGALPLGGRHTILLDLAAGFGSGYVPYQEQFGIGGADTLLGFPVPGYYRREFTGSNALAGVVSYRFRVAEYQLAAVRALYLTLAGGGGNVWNTREAMTPRDLRTGGSAGIHADTLVGPFRLDYGLGEEHRRIIYFSAGFDF